MLLTVDSKRFIGTSQEEKPNLGEEDAGAIFYESDTRKKFVFFNNAWHEMGISMWTPADDIQTVSLLKSILLEIRETNQHLRMITEMEDVQ